jgi:hypothetical protein
MTELDPLTSPDPNRPPYAQMSDDDLLAFYERVAVDPDAPEAPAMLAAMVRRGLALPHEPNATASARLRLVALEQRLPTMTDAEVRRGYNACEVESPEADLYAGEMERRDLDD